MHTFISMAIIELGLRTTTVDYGIGARGVEVVPVVVVVRETASDFAYMAIFTLLVTLLK